MKRAFLVMWLTSCGAAPIGPSLVDGGSSCSVLEVGVVYCVGECSKLACAVTATLNSWQLEQLQLTHPECATRTSKLHPGAITLDCSSTSTIPAGADSTTCGWSAEPGACQ